MASFSVVTKPASATLLAYFQQLTNILIRVRVMITVELFPQRLDPSRAQLGHKILRPRYATEYDWTRLTCPIFARV